MRRTAASPRLAVTRGRAESWPTCARSRSGRVGRIGRRPVVGSRHVRRGDCGVVDARVRVRAEVWPASPRICADASLFPRSGRLATLPSGDARLSVAESLRPAQRAVRAAVAGGWVRSVALTWLGRGGRIAVCVLPGSGVCGDPAARSAIRPRARPRGTDQPVRSCTWSWKGVSDGDGGGLAQRRQPELYLG